MPASMKKYSLTPLDEQMSVFDTWGFICCEEEHVGNKSPI